MQGEAIHTAGLPTLHRWRTHGLCRLLAFRQLQPSRCGLYRPLPNRRCDGNWQYSASQARAIIGRIADANPTGSGVLLVGATNPPNSGVIAIAAGAPLNAFFFSALDATGKLYVKN